MLRSCVSAAALLAALMSIQASPADPLPSETHKVLPAALAVEAAEAAIAYCKANSWIESVAVVDRNGMPRVTIMGDGANYLTREIAHRKAYTAAQWGMSTADFAKRFGHAGGFDPSFYDRELTKGAGGLPIKVGKDTIGGIGAAGAPGADKDEACASAGLKKISDRLK